MGRLVAGVWQDEWYKPDKKGRFVRPDTQFRQLIKADGSTSFAPASGRYHLYVSLACPWAHRTLIARQLKGLQSHLSVNVVNPYMGEHGWTFEPFDDCTGDELYGKKYLYEIYVQAKSDYTGRVTVPVLWDKQNETIVNNESREILRMLSHEFDEFADVNAKLAPGELLSDIDQMIDANYDPINNGVYKCGFADSQAAYDEAADTLFERLDEIEAILAGSRYLCGDQLTEADICLYTTLIRFDPVYAVHFKCSRNRIADYKNLFGYLRDLYQMSAFQETTNFEHIRQHYYWSHETINPKRIVAQAPCIDLTAAHKRN